MVDEVRVTGVTVAGGFAGGLGHGVIELPFGAPQIAI